MRLGLLAAALVAVLTGCAPDEQPDPVPPTSTITCPQEDSCEVQWHDGAWHLRVHAEHTGTGAPGPWVRVSR
jgi:hypothetical protein